MSSEEPVKLRDPKAMRAMAHPLRLQLLEIIREEGAMTATQLSERVGESPANTAFHLRTLAKYGFIEEAGRGPGRTRPWRAVPGGLLIREEELAGPARRAAETLVGALRDVVVRQIERWSVERDRYPPEWQSAGFETEFRSQLTAEELADVSRRIGRILEPYSRPNRKRPKDAKQVTIVAWGFPTEPPDGAQPGDAT